MVTYNFAKKSAPPPQFPVPTPMVLGLNQQLGSNVITRMLNTQFNSNKKIFKKFFFHWNTHDL